MTAIKREEVIGDCRLILGDNVPIMADMAANEFQLAIVDPEYGIGESGDHESRNRVATNNYTPKSWDNEPPAVEYFKELLRASKNQIIWGANHFISRIPFDSSCWVVWDKENGGCDFADSELAWTSFSSAVRNFKFRRAGMLQGDMKNKEIRIHPTQKPVALYRWLLKNYAKKGDHILDTHAGSFSSVIACLDMGIKITCIEIDEDYFNAGVERVRQYQRQGKLFAPPKQQPKPQGLF